jgi:hypothetical protein
MRRSLLLLACLTMPLAGCTLCASPYDYDYGLFGGSWQRYEPSQGRVGSRFNNAGAPINPHREELIQTPGEPTPIESPTTPEIPTPLRPGGQEGI